MSERESDVLETMPRVNKSVVGLACVPARYITEEIGITDILFRI